MEGTIQLDIPQKKTILFNLFNVYNRRNHSGAFRNKILLDNLEISQFLKFFFLF